MQQQLRVNIGILFVHILLTEHERQYYSSLKLDLCSE